RGLGWLLCRGLRSAALRCRASGGGPGSLDGRHGRCRLLQSRNVRARCRPADRRRVPPRTRGADRSVPMDARPRARGGILPMILHEGGKGDAMATVYFGTNRRQTGPLSFGAMMGPLDRTGLICAEATVDGLTLAN